MRKILIIIVSTIIATIVLVNLTLGHLRTAQSVNTQENICIASDTSFPEAEIRTEPEPVSRKLWIDTIMFAKGHSFGYSGDVSDWDGWYYDTVRVGNDHMLTYDSVGPSSLRLDLVTRSITVDLGSKKAAGEIKKFLSPIDGFKRFEKEYTIALDSVYDEDYGIIRCLGKISFTADYVDTCNTDAGKINRFMVDLVYNSGDTEMGAPALTSLYIGYKRPRQSGKKYDGAVKDMAILSDFIRDKTVEWWKEDDDLPYEGSAATSLAVRGNIANSSFVTFSVYDYNRMGSGHGGYIETFHSFDIKNGKELSNTDIFNPKMLDKVKLLLYDVMANHPRYTAWNRGIKSATDVQARFEGTKLDEQEDSEFALPQGALTNSGVVFSFQPYEIGCWAEGAYHFVIPYKSLMPYLTSRTKDLLRKVGL